MAIAASLAGCANHPPHAFPSVFHPDAADEGTIGAPAAAPGGFDCSGLVSFAAQRAGLDLPRTAKDQLRTGVPVSRAKLEPGDLVFMRLAHKELHVGIALGSGRFIHAPAAGGRVRIDSLSAPPYSTGFLSARRVIR